MASQERVYDDPGRSISSDPSLHFPPQQTGALPQPTRVEAHSEKVRRMSK